MDTLDVALRAAELISERGHCKRAYEDERGRLCFRGALNAAINGNPLFLNTGTGTECEKKERLQLWCDIYRTAVSLLGRDPTLWNDAESTSGEDVILLLKRIAEKLA